MRRTIIAAATFLAAISFASAAIAQDKEIERRMLERELKRDPENSAIIIKLCSSFMLGGEQREIAISMVELANPGTSSDLYVVCPMLRKHGYID